MVQEVWLKEQAGKQEKHLHSTIPVPVYVKLGATVAAGDKCVPMAGGLGH